MLLWQNVCLFLRTKFNFSRKVLVRVYFVAAMEGESYREGTGSQEGTELSSRERSPLLLKLPFVNSLPGSVWAIVPGKSSIENQALQLILYSSFEGTRTISGNLVWVLMSCAHTLRMPPWACHGKISLFNVLWHGAHVSQVALSASSWRRWEPREPKSLAPLWFQGRSLLSPPKAELGAPAPWWRDVYQSQPHIGLQRPSELLFLP